MPGVAHIKNWAGIVVDNYVDNIYCEQSPGTTWSFNNGSTSATCSTTDGDAGNPAIGDYVKLETDAGTAWTLVDARPDKDTITLSENYKGTTDTGTCRNTANDGSSKNDAWKSLQDAFNAGSAAIREKVTAVRRNQTHVATAGVTWDPQEMSRNDPTLFIADNDTLELWSEDSGDVRPIYDVTSNNYSLASGSNTINVVFINLHFKGDDGDESFLTGGATLAYYYNCKFENVQAAGCIFVDCDLDLPGANTTNYNVLPILYGLFSDCSFDGGKYGIYTGTASDRAYRFFLENCVFGAANTHSTADISVNQGSLIRMRNTLFNSVTEIQLNRYYAVAVNMPNELRAIEDYGASKGAWYAINEFEMQDSGLRDTLSSFASAGTVAGKRAGGADSVIKVLAGNESGVFDLFALLAHEQPLNCTSTGTATVDVWTQPNGWAAVPDTEGSDANVWVEVAAWDVATSKYKYFDSRDEGAQDAQVNDEWHKIRVTGVEVDAMGTIIVRVYQSYGDGADILYVDYVAPGDVSIV